MALLTTINCELYRNRPSHSAKPYRQSSRNCCSRCLCNPGIGIIEQRCGGLGSLSGGCARLRSSASDTACGQMRANANITLITLIKNETEPWTEVGSC